MKSIKFFAALAIPAMFAACTNEEIVVDTPQKMQEVVGAELVGSDISLFASNGNSVESRLAGGKSSWETQDKLGLGWVVNNTASSEQDITKKPSKSNLYANHLFEKAGEGDMFSTKGNVYKGWHFAYYPFDYMEQPTKKVIEISPKQTVGYHATTEDKNTPWYQRLSQRFQMSALQFLTKEQHLDPETYQLKTTFPMKSPLGQIVVTTQLEENSAFATNTNLKQYDINYVKINLGKAAFADYAELDLTKLYVLDADVDKTIMDIPTANEANTNGLLNSFKDVLIPTDENGGKVELVSSTKTEVAVEGFKVTTNGPRIQMFALPVAEAFEFTEKDYEEVTIEVGAGGGYFEIGYTTGDNLTVDEEINNNAIVELINAYSEIERNETGKKTKGKLVASNEGDNVVLNVVLRDREFIADFTGVNNDNWAEKVQLANDLSLENQVFVLEENAAINFEGENLDEKGGILIPEGGVIVETCDDNFKSGSLNITTKDTEWSNKIAFGNKITINVAEDAELKINSEMTPARLYNYGTIYAGPLATVGQKTTNGGNLVNKSEIYVEYGAILNADQNNTGIVKYKVPQAYVVDEIKTLLSTTNTKGQARVNTLVIGEGVVLDFTEKGEDTPGTQPSGDRYNDTAGTESVPGEAVDFGDLTGVSLEINNGGVVKSSTHPVTVKNVYINSGRLDNVNVGGEYLVVKDGEVNVSEISADLTLMSGEVTAEEIEGNVTLKGGTISDAVITGNVEVESGCTANLMGVSVYGTLTINGTANLKSGESIKVTDLVNNGTLNSNNDIEVKTVKLNPGSTTTLKSDDSQTFDKTIWWTISAETKEITLKGTVAKLASLVLKENLDAATQGKTVKLEDNVDYVGIATINDGVIFDGGHYTLSIGEATVDNRGNNEDVLRLVQTIGDATIKNVTIDGNNATLDGKNSKDEDTTFGIRGIYMTGAGTIEIENVIIKNVTYTISTVDNNQRTLNVKNSTLEGWTSYGSSTTASFDNVNFKVGKTQRTFRPHGATTLKNCHFEEGFKILFDKYIGEITLDMFEDCTYGGKKIISVSHYEVADGGYLTTLNLEGENTPVQVN